VRLLPRAIEGADHLREVYIAAGRTDDHGHITFLGLAPGLYEAFGADGSTFLGELRLLAVQAQEADLHFQIPFLHGRVKLPDGEVARHLMVFVRMTNPGGREFGPFPSDAYRGNELLREQGTVFVPLLSFGSTFRVRFAAMEGGRAFEEDDWRTINDFALVSEELTVKVTEEKGWPVDVSLAPNPEYQQE
jgi:hypothetical protein